MDVPSKTREANELLRGGQAEEALAVLRSALDGEPDLPPRSKSTVLANQGLCGISK